MMAWLPIFFMYFSSCLSVADVLILESIYYFSVVVLEIPSGYFSDRIGRRITLIISSLAFAISYFLFGFIEPSFGLLIAAQVFLAVGMSFLSGTDTAFYYESLESENLSHEFVQREAGIQTKKQIASAFAVLLGGVLGSLQLRYGYVLSFVFILPALFISFSFVEPVQRNLTNSNGFLSQLKSVRKQILRPELKWLFIFSINLFILSHIPYEFYQSYLVLLDDQGMSFGIHAAIYSGLVFSVTRIFGAYASNMSPVWLTKYGLKKLCFVALFFQLAIIIGMASILHLAIVSIILLRSFSMSLVSAPISAEIAPRLEESQRATYFSVQSLASRLSYSLTLILLSRFVAGEASNWSSLSYILMMSCVLGIVLLIPLFFINPGSLFKSKY